MGNAISRARLVLYEAAELFKVYSDVAKRIKRSPGLPVQGPTEAYWQVPRAHIARYKSELPGEVDVVVVGSGITGTSVARALLEHRGDGEKGPGVKVVMLEARETCSGATGRNGGHVNPPLYHDYTTMKARHGVETAQKVIRLRLAHLREMQAVARAEDVLQPSQARAVESFDVYYEREEYEAAKEKLAAWRADMPKEADGFEAVDGEEAVERFALSVRTAGVVYGSGGAMHPYRFVTGVLKSLLERYPDNFFLATETPCTDIIAPSDGSALYTVRTPAGELRAAHVVHATNGWAAHLLAPMRSKIIPVRGVMSAQRPGQGLSPADPFADPPQHPQSQSASASTVSGCPIPVPGMRSYVFYPGTGGYDYLTQLPAGEMMFGGGFVRGGGEGMDEIGESDDRDYNVRIGAHLGGALSVYFGEEGWGREGADDRERGGEDDGGPVAMADDIKGCGEEGEGAKVWHAGRVKAFWSGILGISADGQPWVGRVPDMISGRKAPKHKIRHHHDIKPKDREGGELAPPGEWIAAGYTGEGMVHAWMCGKALGCMIRGERAEREAKLAEWFPDIMRVTEKRWKKADVLALLESRRGE